MLLSILISIATAVGATTDLLIPVGSLYEDFYTPENSDRFAPDDYGIFSLNTGDFTLGSFQNLDFDDVLYDTSDDQASSDFSDQLFDSDSLNSAPKTFCNIGKRDDGGACPVDSAPQDRLEPPDFVQMGNIVVTGDPLLAPITLEIEENPSGKCVDLQHPVNLCCKGPLGLLAGGYFPLVVYETIGRCRPGK